MVFQLTCVLPVCKQRGSSHNGSPSTLRFILRLGRSEADKGCARMGGRTLSPLQYWRLRRLFFAVWALAVAIQAGQRIAAASSQHT